MLAGSILAVSLLAGCTSAAVPEDDAVASAETASPAVSETSPVIEATAPPTDADTPELIIDLAGVGPFRLGDSVADAVNELPRAYKVLPDGTCPNPATTVLTSETGPTIWLQESDEGAGLVVVAVGGDGMSGASDNEAPQTEGGIGVGSPLTEVETAFPDGVLETDLQGVPDRLVVSGTTGAGDAHHLVFSFSGDAVETILVQSSPDKVWEFCG